MIIVSYPLRFKAGTDTRLETEVAIIMESHGMVDVGSGAGFGMRDLEYAFEIDDTSEDAVREVNNRQYALMKNQAIVDEILAKVGKGGKVVFQPDEVFDVNIDDWRGAEGDYAEVEAKA